MDGLSHYRPRVFGNNRRAFEELHRAVRAGEGTGQHLIAFGGRHRALAKIKIKVATVIRRPNLSLPNMDFSGLAVGG